jgi:hypothetical protein
MEKSANEKGRIAPARFIVNLKKLFIVLLILRSCFGSDQGNCR